jgi:hypothetical protein
LRFSCSGLCPSLLLAPSTCSSLPAPSLVSLVSVSLVVVRSGGGGGGARPLLVPGLLLEAGRIAGRGLRRLPGLLFQVKSPLLLLLVLLLLLLLLPRPPRLALSLLALSPRSALSKYPSVVGVERDIPSQQVQASTQPSTGRDLLSKWCFPSGGACSCWLGLSRDAPGNAGNRAWLGRSIRFFSGKVSLRVTCGPDAEMRSVEAGQLRLQACCRWRCRWEESRRQRGRTCIAGTESISTCRVHLDSQAEVDRQKKTGHAQINLLLLYLS